MNSFDFKDIDEIVLGKTSTTKSDQTDWQECFDETTQAVYYWNTKTNECSWDPPLISDNQSITSELNSKFHSIEREFHVFKYDFLDKKRSQTTTESKSTKKLKKPSLIAEYTSSESENVDEIDDLLDEVLDKDEKQTEQITSIDLYPFFEADCRAALARLSDLPEQSKDILTLQIQLEVSNKSFQSVNIYFFHSNRLV